MPTRVAFSFTSAGWAVVMVVILLHVIFGPG